MPLTAAEKQKKYRERLKNENPQKYEEIQKKAKERSARYYEKKKCNYTEEEKQNLRQKWREDRKKAKDAKMVLQNEPLTSQASNSKHTNNQLVSLNMHRRVEYRLKHENAQLRSQVNTLTKGFKNLQKKMIRQQKKIERMNKDYDNILMKLNTEKETEDIFIRELEEKTPIKKVTEFLNNIIPDVETPKKEEIKKKLLEHDILTESLKFQFQNATNTEKNVLRKVLDNNIVKKYKQKTKIRTSLGFKSNFKNYRHQKTKTTLLQKKIECFFNRDDVSRATAGKKEYRTFKKVTRQKRYLLDKLSVLHNKYISEEGLISFSTFKKYRPFYVIPPKIKDCESCACIKHSNMQFLVDALKSLNILKTDNLNEVTADLVCDFNSENCMYNNCNACSEIKLKVDNEKLSNEASWFTWVLKEHEYEKQGEKKKIKKMTKIKKEGTLQGLLETFRAEMRKFKTHVFNFYFQYKKYKDCINNLKDDEACIHIDFSENFTCKYHQEIQAMHFIKEQVTLHTGVIYIKGEKKPISFCSISPNNQHNPEAIWAHLDPVLKHIKINYSNIRTIHFFSDGPTTQYKQKKNFYLFSEKVYEYGFNHGTWSFFEAAHGKGAADGIGGVIKRTLDAKIAQGTDIPNAETAFDVLVSQTDTSIKLFYIPSLNIKPIDTKLSPLPQTMKIHQLITTEKLKLKHRHLSCFCGDPRGTCECHSPVSHSFLPIISTNEKQLNEQRKSKQDKEVKISKNSKTIRRRRTSTSSSSEEDDNDDNIEYAESDATEFFSEDENSRITVLDEKTGILKPKIDPMKKVTLLSEVILKKPNEKTNTKEIHKRKILCESEQLMQKRLRVSTQLLSGKDDVTVLSQIRNVPENIASCNLRDSNIFKENIFNKEALKDEEENFEIKYTKAHGSKQINDTGEEDNNIKAAAKCKEMNKTYLDKKNKTENFKEDENYNKESNINEKGRKTIESKENEQNNHILDLNDSVLVRYYQRKTWKYFIGFIENIEFKAGESYYKVKFLKTVKDSFDSVKFVVQRKLDVDIVTIISIVKKVKLIQQQEDSKVYYLFNESDIVFF